MTPVDTATHSITDGLIDSATSLLLDRMNERDARRPNAESEIRALLTATLDTIIEIGSLDPPVRDILARSNLSRQVFYHYFDSKDELLLATFAAGWRTVADYVDDRIATADTHADKLCAWIAGVMRQAQSPRVSRLTKPFAFTGQRLEQRYPDEYAQARGALVGSLTRVLVDGIAAGEFATDQPEQDALALYDAVFARQNRYVMIGRLAGADDVDALYHFALRAVTARP